MTRPRCLENIPSRSQFERSRLAVKLIGAYGHALVGGRPKRTTAAQNAPSSLRSGYLEHYLAASVPALIEFMSLPSFRQRQHGFDYRLELP